MALPTQRRKLGDLCVSKWTWFLHHLRLLFLNLIEEGYLQARHTQVGTAVGVRYQPATTAVVPKFHEPQRQWKPFFYTNVP